MGDFEYGDFILVFRLSEVGRASSFDNRIVLRRYTSEVKNDIFFSY